MTNGDRLTGTIIGMADGKVVLKSDTLGELKIPPDHIATVSTDKAVAVEFVEGGYVTGNLLPADDGSVQLRGDNETEAKFKWAQVKNVYPDGKIPVPQFVWSGHVDVGLSKTSGNTRNEAYNVDAEAIGRGEKDRITLGGEYHREDADDRRTVDNLWLGAQYDRFLSEVWYLYASTSVERDEFKDLNLRTMVGAGAGYQVIDTEDTQLSFEAGPAYVIEDFDTSPDNFFMAARWATRYSMWVFERFAQLFHNHELLFNLDDTNDYLLRSETGARVPIREGINVAAQVDWDYDNQPPPGTDKSDTRYVLSVGYAW
jgi:putative salt-induced outer membrane protein YdiY